MQYVQIIIDLKVPFLPDKIAINSVVKFVNLDCISHNNWFDISYLQIEIILIYSSSKFC